MTSRIEFGSTGHKKLARAADSFPEGTSTGPHSSIARVREVEGIQERQHVRECNWRPLSAPRRGWSQFLDGVLGDPKLITSVPCSTVHGVPEREAGQPAVEASA